MSSSSKIRSIQTILPKQRHHWVGDGFHVRPVFGTSAFTNELSPFLMFDYAEPKQFQPSTRKQPLGVGKHPHRGFETVTVAFQGEVQHHDNFGHSGVIGPGDVQWMTAARGLVHEEYHSHEFTKSGGTFEMCQLWVNLPAKDKLTKPRYQSIVSSQIPTVPIIKSNNGSNDKNDDEVTSDATIAKARIIAGELNGIKGPAKTFSPVQLWDVTISSPQQEDSPVDIPFPSKQSCLIFCRRGGPIKVNGQVLGDQQIAILTDGDTIRLESISSDKEEGKDNNTCDASSTSVLIMGGEPLNEPIAARGPFVMNTDAELREAMIAYSNGEMGPITE